MRALKRLLIDALEKACAITGHAGGCYLAGRSLALDERWQVDMWLGPDPKYGVGKPSIGSTVATVTHPSGTWSTGDIVTMRFSNGTTAWTGTLTDPQE